MAQEAAVPKGFRAMVQKMIDDSISKALRAGPLRNATISGGKGLTVGPGSKIVVRHPNGNVLMLMGAYDFDDAFDMPDGSHQPMALVARADGSLALAMYDPNPSDGFEQFLALLDRAGNVIMSDDTDSGQGLARPYVPSTFYPARYTDMTVASTSSVFETLFAAVVYKQHPKMVIGLSATMDTAGTSGEVRVLVNGVQLDTTRTEGFAIVGESFAGSVAGDHMSALRVEIQGRRTSASGSLRVVPAYLWGLQS